MKAEYVEVFWGFYPAAQASRLLRPLVCPTVEGLLAVFHTSECLYILVILRCRGSLGEHVSLHRWRATFFLLDCGPKAHLHRQRRHELEVAVQGNNAEEPLLCAQHLMYFNNKKTTDKTPCLTFCLL